jgi:DTW domain-containing protein YfiP
MHHALFQLRENSLAKCTRPFNARGSSVKRCPKCHLASFACLCAWQLTRTSDIHFILIVHHKELYKTTNTGRLIADFLPESTSAYLWSRTEPDAKLLVEIVNPSRRVVLLFPEDKMNTREKQLNTIAIKTTKREAQNERPLTVILLDGTWKQASRMANLSAWLQNIERHSIAPNSITENQDNYIRKAPQEYQLSTAQAAACILREFNDSQNADLLERYFSVFNQHCIATRRNISPTISDSHNVLTQAKNNTG